MFHYSPKKTLNESNSLLFYSPANGQVIRILKSAKNIRIGIYLRIYNLHTQYIPILGKKVAEEYIYGNNSFANDIDKSEHNQRMIHTFINPKIGEYKVIQYSGFFTRRIYSLSSISNTYSPGDYIGYIRFGSRVDIICKRESAQILVKKDQMVNVLTPLIQYSNLKKQL